MQFRSLAHNGRALCLCLNLKNRCSKFIHNLNKDKMIQTHSSVGIAQNPLLPAVLSQPTIESYNTGDLLFYSEYNGKDLWTNYANAICCVVEEKGVKFVDTLYYTQDDGKSLKILEHLDRLTADLQYLNLYRKIGIVSDLQNMSLDDINERYAVK